MPCKVMSTYFMTLDHWLIDDPEGDTMWFVEIISRSYERKIQYELHVRNHKHGVDVKVDLDNTVACILFEDIVVDQGKFLETIKEIANVK